MRLMAKRLVNIIRLVYDSDIEWVGFEFGVI